MYIQNLLVVAVASHRLDEMRQDKLATTIPAQPTEHSVLHQYFDFDKHTVLYRANAHSLSRHVDSPPSSQTPAHHDGDVLERVIPLTA